MNRVFRFIWGFSTGYLTLSVSYVLLQNLHSWLLYIDIEHSYIFTIQIITMKGHVSTVFGLAIAAMVGGAVFNPNHHLRFVCLSIKPTNSQ